MITPVLQVEQRLEEADMALCILEELTRDSIGNGVSFVRDVIDTKQDSYVKQDVDSAS